MENVELKRYSLEEWKEIGTKKYGTDDFLEWPLICPRCKTVQKGKELIKLGISREDTLGYVGYSCIGRFNKKEDKRGCDWTLGGLFQIHNAEIYKDGEIRPVFEFA